ncbi:hypothetical protein L7Q78_39170, partial [Achromobacter xylosoxidans]|nr:hypothetical protein [Achromobacter xylosoxidans]
FGQAVARRYPWRVIPDFKARAILPPPGGARGQADACSAKIGRWRCAVQIQKRQEKADQFADTRQMECGAA